MKRLEGKIAIITGASAGIGKASALLFASEGASLGLIDINLDGGKEVCEEIRKNGGKAEFFGIDVSNPEAMKGSSRQTVSVEFQGWVHTKRRNPMDLHRCRECRLRKG